MKHESLQDLITALEQQTGSHVTIVDIDQSPFEDNMPKKDDMKRIEFVLPSALRDVFREALRKSGRHQSDVLRDAVENFCKQHGVDVPAHDVKWGGNRHEESK